MTKDERIKQLRTALGFYARAVAWAGANQRNDGRDPYTPTAQPYIQDASRDGGAVARAALAFPDSPALAHDADAPPQF